MSKVEEAVFCLRDGFSCAQAVVSAYGPDLGLDRELALRVAGAFGAGMASTGRTCGAVTGALMVIGLQHGKTEAKDNETKKICYDGAKAFLAQFEALNGSITCKELLGCDVSIAEEKERAREAGLFATVCPKLVEDAAEIVGYILSD